MHSAYLKLCLSCLKACVILNSIVMAVTTCSAQEAADDTSAVAAAHYDVFAQQAKNLSLAVEGGERLVLRDTPLQKFSIGGATFGSVFLWLDHENRPAAIGTLGSLPVWDQDFGFAEIHWLVPKPSEPVAIQGRFTQRWTARGQELVGKQLNDVPSPAQNETARLTQMRAIARSFEADMLQDKERNKLRLLSQPLYRYPDSTPDHDGAIFAWIWTVGTDPEVLMHIYTQKVGEQNVWFYQPLRFTYRPVELRRHDREVWQVDEAFSRDKPQQTGPYMTTLTQPVELKSSR